jgi:hypothetical protein
MKKLILVLLWLCSTAVFAHGSSHVYHFTAGKDNIGNSYLHCKDIYIAEVDLLYLTWSYPTPHDYKIQPYKVASHQLSRLQSDFDDTNCQTYNTPKYDLNQYQ